jgi:hypothetical protein
MFHEYGSVSLVVFQGDIDIQITCKQFNQAIDQHKHLQILNFIQ